MLRSTIADIVRKGQAKEPITETEELLLKEYLRAAIMQVRGTEYAATKKEQPICEAIRKTFRKTFMVVLNEKLNKSSHKN
jgi:hypothetical protein